MKPLTKIWATGMIIGWALLIAGWITGSYILDGTAAVIFLAFTIERFENLKIERRGKQSR